MGDKLIVAGRGFFSRVAGFFRGSRVFNKNRGFFRGYFFASFSSGVLISCYRVLPGGGAGGKDVLNETSAVLFISLQDKAKYYSYY